MANCLVRKWYNSLIGNPSITQTFNFSTKMHTFGTSHVKKKMIEVGVSLNWDSNIKFYVLVKYRKDINSGFSPWGIISTETTFPDEGLAVDSNYYTTAKGGHTFVLPFTDTQDDLKTTFYNIQFNLTIYGLLNNSDGTGNVAINDINFLYRKFRSYGDSGG